MHKGGPSAFHSAIYEPKSEENFQTLSVLWDATFQVWLALLERNGFLLRNLPLSLSCMLHHLHMEPSFPLCLCVPALAHHFPSKSPFYKCKISIQVKVEVKIFNPHLLFIRNLSAPTF
jgi:hypothetical protein